MANFCLKKPSKRMTCRKKYKIAKKIREYNRKKRKESKKLMNKPLKKLIHVPNICPFKEEILKDAAEYKKQKQIEQQKARKLLLEAKKEKPTSIQELVDTAQNKQVEHEQINKTDDDIVVRKDSNGQRKSYYREFQKVVASADVILEVVDARDPLGTRCPAVEQCVRQAGDVKRLVLVLNKADLVPREILDKWIKFLRMSVPAIPFKSSTQAQNRKLGRMKMKKNVDVGSNSVCIGAEGLTSLLANYCRNKGIKTSIRVGVVGLPNVGKSSLINSLKRSKSCKVGAVPGVTRSLQEVQLDTKIKLLDSPGLALASSTDPHAALKNSVLSADSIEPAEMIIARANKEQLMEMYLLPSFNNHSEFLLALAKRYGRYKRGGVADLNAAAKILVDDWNRGKISYYVQPPEVESSHIISSTIVSCPSEVAEFDLDKYDKEVKIEMPMDIDMSETGTVSSKGGEVVVSSKKRKKKMSKEEVEKKKEDSLMKMEGNMRLNKINKLKMKKKRKQKARNERAAEQLADTIANVQL
ncbi:UNVERIFIED_CONTAM: hypothetical protein PYX00_001844 [Menopon gallinae]|uniref:CP-type G domain-containing protein n=1 Tax=Menopon gallinae TaxID=328185 RepID=A0AAW2IEC3_9NEOP